MNSDDKATPTVELTELRDVHQLGFEAFGGGAGKLDGGKESALPLPSTTPPPSPSPSPSPN